MSDIVLVFGLVNTRVRRCSLTSITLVLHRQRKIPCRIPFFFFFLVICYFYWNRLSRPLVESMLVVRYSRMNRWILILENLSDLNIELQKFVNEYIYYHVNWKLHDWNIIIAISPVIRYFNQNIINSFDRLWTIKQLIDSLSKIYLWII